LHKDLARTDCSKWQRQITKIRTKSRTDMWRQATEDAFFANPADPMFVRHKSMKKRVSKKVAMWEHSRIEVK
jgi:hypothetical protein